MTARRNRVTLADIGELTPDKLALLPVENLAMLQEELIEETDILKRRSALLLSGLTIRYGKRDAQERRAKPTGTVRFPDPDGRGYEVISDAAKEVKWDQAKLETAMNEIPEGWGHLAKVEISVPEAKYAAALPSIQSKLDSARTIMARASRFKIVKKEE
jgi:hypothetical protein